MCCLNRMIGWLLGRKLLLRFLILLMVWMVVRGMLSVLVVVCRLVVVRWWMLCVLDCSVVMVLGLVMLLMIRLKWICVMCMVVVVFV